MPTLNYTTSVDVGRTVAQMQQLLAEHGAGAIMVRYTDRQPTGLTFSLPGPPGQPHDQLAFTLPVDVDAVHRRRSDMSTEDRVTRPYRIGWWTHAWWPTRPLLIGLLTGNQPSPRVDGSRRVGRRLFVDPLRRRLRSIRRPHRPWQAESDAMSFARRSFTAAGAERKILADVAHAERHGLPSPHQYWRLLRKARHHARQATHG